jgi:hypothetical protein
LGLHTARSAAVGVESWRSPFVQARKTGRFAALHSTPIHALFGVDGIHKSTILEAHKSLSTKLILSFS